MKQFFRMTPLVLLILLLAACAAPVAPADTTAPADSAAPADASAGDDSAGDGASLTFWSTEELPDRAARTQEILARFTEATGISVELVLVNEDQLPNLVTASVAADSLPDVIFFPVDFAIGWAEQGILNPDAASAVIESLDPATFAQGALDMVRYEDSFAAVPTDGWGQILVYRQDLFDAAGLERPDTFERIQAAAEALNDPNNNFYGITASNDAGAVFTQQTFEQFALANNCQLVDDSGAVSMDTPECVEAIRFFTELLRDYSPAGVQDVDTTRSTYFAGQAAMVVWSPFILDEMAGLRDDAFPACPECADDPGYLAGASGVVPTILGPNGTTPSQYGQISLLGITATADAEASQQLIEYWLSDGYLDWLAVSVEGKFPMRQGTPEEPDLFIEGWSQLETGVDRRAMLSEFYSEETIQAIIEGAGGFQRWGFVQGQGALVAAVYESLVVPRALRDVIDGTLTPEEAAAELQIEVEELQNN